jgi:ribosome-associated translation inhibitor RaiA
MKEILEVQEQIKQVERQIKNLANALLQLSKEVRSNREFIETQANLSKKTVEALRQLTEI